jgi:hypothetical protein
MNGASANPGPHNQGGIQTRGEQRSVSHLQRSSGIFQEAGFLTPQNTPLPHKVNLGAAGL